MIRRLTPVQLAADLVVALLFGLFCWAIESRGVTLGTSAVLVVMTVALLARRLNPAAALGFAWLGAILQMALSVSAPSFADLAALGVLYCTASYGAAAAIDFARAFLFPLFGLLALLGLSWTLGLLTRTYRRARDSRRAQALAEKDVVVEQERNRIARDMHDVVAHSLAVVIAQADGARYAAAKDPAAVDAALTTISTTAREALGDVRLLLTQLRHSQGDGPQPALGDLDRLVEQFRAAGLDVQRSDRGSAGLLASGQQLALFRIVQEALTNALRHGDTSQPVVLAFDWAEPVSVVISNALGDSAPHPGGHGVVGMRERAALVAGTLTAGANGDRWVVAGTVPS